MTSGPGLRLHGFYRAYRPSDPLTDPASVVGSLPWRKPIWFQHHILLAPSNCQVLVVVVAVVVLSKLCRALEPVPALEE